MTELEFKTLATQGYNRIPLIAEAFADLETPLSLYLKLAQTQNNGKNSFLLESVVGGERFGRYSFIGLPATTLMRSFGTRIEVVKNDAIVETHEEQSRVWNIRKMGLGILICIVWFLMIYLQNYL